MKTTILTTKEVAEYLKLNEKTVLKMAQNKEIPAVKVANQWRFYLSAIDEYLQDKITRNTSHDFERIVTTGNTIMPLSRLIDALHINLDLKAKDKNSVLRELADSSYSAGITVSAENLLIQLIKRESMLSTAVGGGIAIPHSRNPNDELFNNPGVIIGISKEGVDFSAPDREKVHLLFLVCAPDVVLHLKLLSKVAALLNTRGTYESFLEANTPDDIIKILLKHERLDLVTR